MIQNVQAKLHNMTQNVYNVIQDTTCIIQCKQVTMAMIKTHMEQFTT